MNGKLAPCDRCGTVDAVTSFDECSECGPIELCAECIARHRQEIAEEQSYEEGVRRAAEEGGPRWR